jgi:hypothetical protein
MPIARVIAASCLALALAGCGLLQQRPVQGLLPQAQLAPFSSARPGGPMPRGWYAAALPRFKKSTRYELVDDGGLTVVRAFANGSSSGLAFNVDVDPRESPILRWRWKVPRAIPGADNTRRETEDAPARIEVIFDGPKSRLPFDERLFFAQVKAVAGLDMPYATLDYAWGAGAPADSVLINTWTTRVRSILVRSGSDGLGQWQSEERNVYEDYKRAYGEEPGRITQVALFTDADATGVQVEAFYGDVTFVKAGAAAR